MSTHQNRSFQSSKKFKFAFNSLKINLRDTCLRDEACLVDFGFQDLKIDAALSDQKRKFNANMVWYANQCDIDGRKTSLIRPWEMNVAMKQKKKKKAPVVKVL